MDKKQKEIFKIAGKNGWKFVGGVAVLKSDVLYDILYKLNLNLEIHPAEIFLTKFYEARVRLSDGKRFVEAVGFSAGTDPVKADTSIKEAVNMAAISALYKFFALHKYLTIKTNEKVYEALERERQREIAEQKKNQKYFNEFSGAALNFADANHFVLAVEAEGGEILYYDVATEAPYDYEALKNEKTMGAKLCKATIEGSSISCQSAEFIIAD